MVIQRHRTARARTNFSRPVRIALDSGLLAGRQTLFDYGCGRGDDVAGLRSRGIQSEGWDPVHRPDVARCNADVVNLGYVVNVIEDVEERRRTLQAAWELSECVLLVAARLTHEARGLRSRPCGDGVLTRRNTFQKFYTQQELRDWVDGVLGMSSVVAAPGVVFVFRDEGARQEFVASRYRSALSAPSVRMSDVLYEQHRDLLDGLSAFVTSRGRLPGDGELSTESEIVAKVGSLKRAFGIVRRVTSEEGWAEIAKERAQDFLIYLALDRFGGRLKFSEQPRGIQLDAKAFFGAYKRACEQADDLLFSLGQPGRIEQACKTAPAGKLTHDALYVHVSTLDRLPAVLRLYEGCARSYVGNVEGANILKLHRQKPKVSYLSYPSFDKKAHPQLAKALVVPLREFNVKHWDWCDSDNPPILHRKEQFVFPDYPGWEKFGALTRQEERAGLYANTLRIGREKEWASILAVKGLAIRGHRLVRVSEA